jgi:hypothetical protein
MRTLAIAALLVSASAMATDSGLKKVSFSVGGRGGLNYTFYNCDSVEDRVETLIEKLGGTSVSVRCTGGLDTWGHMPPMPAYVTATFENAAGNGAVENVTLKSNMDSDCELNVTALNAILPQFENIRVISKRASCFDNSSRWSYNLEITR